MGQGIKYFVEIYLLPSTECTAKLRVNALYSAADTPGLFIHLGANVPAPSKQSQRSPLIHTPGLRLSPCRKKQLKVIANSGNLKKKYIIFPLTPSLLLVGGQHFRSIHPVIKTSY